MRREAAEGERESEQRPLGSSAWGRPVVYKPSTLTGPFAAGDETRTRVAGHLGTIPFSACHRRLSHLTGPGLRLAGGEGGLRRHSGSFLVRTSAGGDGAGPFQLRLRVGGLGWLASE